MQFVGKSERAPPIHKRFQKLTCDFAPIATDEASLDVRDAGIVNEFSILLLGGEAVAGVDGKMFSIFRRIPTINLPLES